MLGIKTNIQSKIDPKTGVYYGRRDLKQYSVSYSCVMHGRSIRMGMILLETVGHAYPAVLIPNESFDSWESAGEMTIQ